MGLHPAACLAHLASVLVFKSFHAGSGRTAGIFCESLVTSPKPRGGELEGLACPPGKKGPLLPTAA